MRGFILSFIALIFVMVTCTIFIVIFLILSYTPAKITKELVVNVVYEPIFAQNMLVSLLNMRNETSGITFAEAIVYAAYQNNVTPKIFRNGKIYRFDLSHYAQKYVDFVCEYPGVKKKCWIFIYDATSRSIVTIAKNIDNPEKEFERSQKEGEAVSRASLPLGFDRWFVIYTRE